MIFAYNRLNFQPCMSLRLVSNNKRTITTTFDSLTIYTTNITLTVSITAEMPFVAYQPLRELPVLKS